MAFDKQQGDGALREMRERIGTGLHSINSFYSTVCDVLKAEADRVNAGSWSISLAGALVDKLWPLIAAALVESRSPAQGPDTEISLRRELWLSHGHMGLYGDDGEMQCGECGIDYKRDSVEQIISRRYENGLRALATPSSPTQQRTGERSAGDCPSDLLTENGWLFCQKGIGHDGVHENGSWLWKDIGRVAGQPQKGPEGTESK